MGLCFGKAALFGERDAQVEVCRGLGNRCGKTSARASLPPCGITATVSCYNDSTHGNSDRFHVAGEQYVLARDDPLREFHARVWSGRVGAASRKVDRDGWFHRGAHQSKEAD